MCLKNKNRLHNYKYKAFIWLLLQKKLNAVRSKPFILKSTTAKFNRNGSDLLYSLGIDQTDQRLKLQK